MNFRKAADFGLRKPQLSWKLSQGFLLIALLFCFACSHPYNNVESYNKLEINNAEVHKDPIYENNLQLKNYKSMKSTKLEKNVNIQHNSETNKVLEPKNDVLHKKIFVAEVVSEVNHKQNNLKSFTRNDSQRHRKRRQLASIAGKTRKIKKLVPYIYQSYLPYVSNVSSLGKPNFGGANPKYSIRGNYFNIPFVPEFPRTPTHSAPSDIMARFGAEDEQDRVVWGLPVSNLPKNSQNTLLVPLRRKPPPLFSDPIPKVNNVPNIMQPTTSKPTLEATNDISGLENNVSQCVWAIVSCCSQNQVNVLFNCFQKLGCTGAFWDLKPCAQEIQWSATNIADKYFE